MIFKRTPRKRSRPVPGFSRVGAGQERRRFWSREHRRKALVLGGAFIVLVAALTERLTPEEDLPDYDVDSNLFAPETIQATFSFPAENLEETREARDKAASGVPETYRLDGRKVARNLDKLNERVEALRGRKDEVAQAVQAALLESDSSDSAEEVVRRAVTEYAASLFADPLFQSFEDPSILAPWLMPADESIPVREFSESAPPDAGAGRPVAALKPAGEMGFANLERLAQVSAKALEYVSRYGVFGPGAVQSAADADKRILVLRGDRAYEDLKLSQEFIESKSAPSQPPPAAASATPAPPTIGRARAMLKDRIGIAVQKAETPDVGEGPVDWSAFQEAAFAMANAALGETLTFDLVTTETARETARREVEPVMKQIHRDQTIQEGGMVWTEQSRSDYQTYLEWLSRGQQAKRSLFTDIAANMLVVLLVLAGLVRFLPLVNPDRDNDFIYLSATSLLLCGTLVTGRVVSYFEPTGYLVPVASAAILLAILTTPRLAAFASVLAAVLVSAQYSYKWGVLIVTLAMSLTGVLGIVAVRKRTDMGSAAVKAAAVGLLAMIAVQLATDSLFQMAGLQRLAIILLNGIACLFLVPGLLSPLERLFGITTDIQLLEYSDLNNEVLSRMAIEIPATFAHSLMLGQLAEAAADAIGANGLLARVCAYYHDIGKLRRPEWFTENQTGANIHDELSPRLSARAIASHVTEGAEMAREFHLPKPMIDAIYEHHGTNMISFFYQEAVKQQKHGDVREEDFRYPGPRPQSRETAILMICDAVESAVRSLKTPNEERVRELVDKIISSRAEDRQFDECDLTLKDLDTISAVVTKRILTSLHGRIAYPTQIKEAPASNVIPM